jgi:hypothetical protein
VVDVEFTAPAAQGAWQFAFERRPEDLVVHVCVCVCVVCVCVCVVCVCVVCV